MKKLRIRISRILAFMLAVLLLAGGMSFVSQARGKIDTSRKGKLTITYKFGDDKLFDGVTSSIYKIASISEDGYSFSLDPDYREVSSITDLSTITDPETAQSDWKRVLEDVRATALSKEPDYTAVSVNGEAVFENIELGIYLVDSSRTEDDDCIYVFAPFLVSVPQLDENDEWIYDGAVYTATAVAKCEKLDKDVEFSLLKRWDDKGGEKKRPASITVEILRDGEPFKTVILSADNDWQFAWKDEAGRQWDFNETVTGELKYKVSITNTVSEDGGKVVYTITNSYTPPNTPPGPPDTPPGPPDTPPDTPGIPGIPEVLGAIRELPAVLGARRLPQTGQLWWPLPVLVIAGIFFIVKGIRKLSADRGKNN